MTIDLYYMSESPPCRAVQMVAANLNIPLNLKPLNLSTGEHLTDNEFGKLNPQRVVPTLVDNGTVLWESRAIMTYLVAKYAPNSTLYPKEANARAKVDQLLYFDIGTLYRTEGQYLMPTLIGKPLDKEKEKPFQDALGLLEGNLRKHKFVAGDDLTLADISLLASLSFAEAADYDLSSFSKICDWQSSLKSSLPHYNEVNEKAVERFTWYLRSKKEAATESE